MAEAIDRNLRNDDVPPGPHDRVRIHDVEELRYWTRTLGISSDELVSAVRAVGNDPGKVREYLGERRAS